MSILSFKAGNRYSLEGMIDYITNPDKTQNQIISGLGVNPNYALQEMQLVKELFHQNGGRLYKQIIFSFDRDIQLSSETIQEISERIGLLFAQNYQVLLAVHFNTSYIHVHYCINTVNVNSGGKYSQSLAELRRYKENINLVLAEYGLNPIKYYCVEFPEIGIEEVVEVDSIFVYDKLA